MADFDVETSQDEPPLEYRIGGIKSGLAALRNFAPA
jgi:hypothetical protein